MQPLSQNLLDFVCRAESLTLEKERQHIWCMLPDQIQSVQKSALVEIIFEAHHFLKAASTESSSLLNRHLHESGKIFEFTLAFIREIRDMETIESKDAEFENFEQRRLHLDFKSIKKREFRHVTALILGVHFCFRLPNLGKIGQ